MMTIGPVFSAVRASRGGRSPAMSRSYQAAILSSYRKELRGVTAVKSAWLIRKKMLIKCKRETEMIYGVSNDAKVTASTLKQQQDLGVDGCDRKPADLIW
jgi:hypothetical protein